MKDPNGEPTGEELDDLSQEIPDLWESLAYKLDMDRVIKGIVNSNHFNTEVKKAREMLLKWREKGSATYEKLGIALKKLDSGRIAKKHGFPQVKILRLRTIECFLPEHVLIIEVQIRVVSIMYIYKRDFCVVGNNCLQKFT